MIGGTTQADVVRVPTPTEVRSALEALFSRPVPVTPGRPWLSDPTDARTGAGSFAVYVDDSLVVRSVIVCDLAFSAFAAAAVGLLPPGAALAALDDGHLPHDLQENLDEVLNICASMQNGEGFPHVRLYRVHHAGTTVPPAVVALSGVLGRRLDLGVTIAGYGDGRLSFVGLPDHGQTS